MKVTTVREADRRIDTPDISNLGIIAYGKNNVYPQEIMRIMANSLTGTSCLKRYNSFLYGQGFLSQALSDVVLNSKDETLDDILQLISNDLACYNGFALHCNFDAFGKIVEVFHVPFEYCRLTQADEKGLIHKIATFDNWDGTKKRDGVSYRPTTDNVDYIHLFSPEDIYNHLQEDRKDGEALDISEYKGQILWVSGSGKLEYPTAEFDSAVTELSTDEGLSNITYKNVRNGMHLGGMIVGIKGNNIPQGDETQEEADYRNENKKNDYQSTITAAQTDVNTGNFIYTEVDTKEEIPQIIPFSGENYDKAFSESLRTVTERIYCAFNQDVFYRLRLGSLGFSTDSIANAFRYYNSTTTTQRQLLTRTLAKLFKYWHEPLPIYDFSISPLEYIVNDTNNEANNNG